MEMFRLHAYSVFPSRTLAETVEPEGGAIRFNAELRGVLEANAAGARFHEQPGVAFVVDTTSRTCDVRDAVMSFAFGEPATARAGALALALRLGASMDRRSSPALFVPAAYENGNRRRVILWVFPSEEAFQLRRTSDGPVVEILREVFSQKSRLRKAARFEGGEGRSDFLEGRILDYQANSMSRDAAEFWIERFLSCTLSIKSDAGSRMLARTIRAAYDGTDSPEDHEQLHAAALAIRRSPSKRISLDTFADRYLTGTIKEGFLAAAPNPESRAALFDYDRNVFDEVLHFRVFQLENGVIVSSPLTQVGSAVKLEGADRRTLVCEGHVVADRMRSRA